jgi:hypothetical protein
VYHHEAGTNENFTALEQSFISGVQTYYPGGFEDWNYFVSWSSGTPDQYPESWWWLNYGESVMALTYEDMNCDLAGNYDLKASAIVRVISVYVGLNLNTIDNKTILPDRYVLHQNYPNPFNPYTRIDYALSQEEVVNISIIDIKGRELSTVVNEKQTAGLHSIVWSAISDDGEPLPSGVYICLMRVNSRHIITRKIILLR